MMEDKEYRPDLDWQNETSQFAEEGLISTTVLTSQLSLSGSINAGWISNTLGVKPRVVLRKGMAVYWHQDQVREVRRALIRFLLEQEFA
jgi:hypothetical protein